MAEPTVVVGVVTKAHGVRGEVTVQNRSDNPDRWVVGATMRTPGGRPLTVTSVRPHGARLLVTFSGVGDRSQAEELRGTELLVPQTSLPALGQDEWWPHELEGCRILTDSGRDLGVLTEVVFNPANDLWVGVADDGVETLVPALRHVVVTVDTEAKRIVVRDIPGLTAPDEDSS